MHGPRQYGRNKNPLAQSAQVMIGQRSHSEQRRQTGGCQHHRRTGHGLHGRVAKKGARDKDGAQGGGNKSDQGQHYVQIAVPGMMEHRIQLRII